VIHLPYIAGAYAAALLIGGILALGAATRLARARRRLAAVDPRSRNGTRA
jgi:hypothetical protein